MNADNLFLFCNNLALIGWVLLLLVPDWKYTRLVVQGGIVSVLLSVIYLYLIVSYFGGLEGGFDSLKSVMLLFQNEYAVLAGWVHYLAFDLWIGSWEAGDALKRGINRWIMIPCLVLTFMFGPIGLLLYMIIRSVKTKKLVLHDNFRATS